MVVPDVNILLYAFRRDTTEHARAREWLDEALARDEQIGLPDVVSSAFIRIVTHPRIYEFPTDVDEAVSFIEALLGSDNCFRVEPGTRHWNIFANLCRSLQLRGPLVPDAYLAAVAIESGSDLITNDRGFARYPGLRWRNPLS